MLPNFSLFGDLTRIAVWITIHPSGWVVSERRWTCSHLFISKMDFSLFVADTFVQNFESGWILWNQISCGSWSNSFGRPIRSFPRHCRQSEQRTDLDSRRNASLDRSSSIKGSWIWSVVHSNRIYEFRFLEPRENQHLLSFDRQCQLLQHNAHPRLCSQINFEGKESCSLLLFWRLKHCFQSDEFAFTRITIIRWFRLHCTDD